MLSHWQQHKSQLRSYIHKRIDDPSAVDDILQEVYIKASTHLHQLKSQGSLGGWLYRIAHNAIMDHYRQQRPTTELPEELAADEAEPAIQAHQKLAQCLRPLIEELPDKYRQPLKLAELEGTSQQQIADQLGLSLSGAKSRVQRARVKLREQLTTCCDIEVGHGGVTHFEPKDPNRRC
ncbi:RNA polymerase sigma factor SigZ [Ferrimonas marina]|uniref:RNA polymerase sigma factor SigZ n=1 Tax=Ferrimonas marina TaxID=299255 RepID=A0A1M5VEM6_9GAMM|nr:RNA polymerase sigma factor SigZ [Ferrimonas marina]SHH73709.1 RNA polymerase, sigma subunit, SigZ [Ferrimonas marina]